MHPCGVVSRQKGKGQGEDARGVAPLVVVEEEEGPWV